MSRPVKLATRVQYGELAKNAVKDIDARHGLAELKLDDVASRLNVSSSTLKRALRLQGLAFSTELESARMKRAVDLLIRQHSCTEIAERVGYSSPQRFSEAFSRFFGVPPSQVRRLFKVAGQQARRYRRPPAPLGSELARRTLAGARRDRALIRRLLRGFDTTLLTAEQRERFVRGLADPVSESDAMPADKDPVVLPPQRLRQPGGGRRGRRWPRAAQQRSTALRAEKLRESA